MVTKTRPRKQEKDFVKIRQHDGANLCSLFSSCAPLSKKFFLQNGSTKFWITLAYFRHWSSVLIREVSTKSLRDFPSISRNMSKSGCCEGFLERSLKFNTKSRRNFCEKISVNSLDQVLQHMKKFRNFVEQFWRRAPQV